MKINWPRLIVGGLIAAIICFMSDGFFTNNSWVGTGKRYIAISE